MKTGPTIARHASKQDYATPDDFIYAVEKRFGPIVFDLAASAENAVVEDYYSIENDSLKQSWADQLTHGRLMWLNPPFDDIEPWAEKCRNESQLGCKIAFLTPASVGSNWFRDHVYGHALIYALNGRLTFKGCATPYPKDCILSVFGAMPPCKFIDHFEVWKWKQT